MSITPARKPNAQNPAVFVGENAEDRRPDLVTAIFDVLIETNPELAELREEGEAAVRHRLSGLRGARAGGGAGGPLRRRGGPL